MAFSGHFASQLRDFHSKLGELRPVLVLLEGDLGVGKTTFVKELLAAWGYSAAQVQSPTFLKLLEHEVPGAGLCLHLDCYRIDDPEDFDRMGLESYLHANFWFVEWPEVLLAHFSARPELRRLLGFRTILRMNFVMNDEGERLVEILKVSDV